MKRTTMLLLLALSAMSAAASPLATRQWTSNYVAQAVSSSSAYSIIATLVNSGIVSPGGGSSGESVFAPSNGIASVSFAVAGTNGVPAIVDRQYTVSVRTEMSPPYLGARIVSSALDGCPTGTLYACVAPGVLVCSSITGGCSRLGFEQSGGRWYVYSDAPDGCDWRSKNKGDRIQVSKWAPTNGVFELVGTFSIVPHSLTSDEFAATAGGAGVAAGANDWCAAATNQAASVVFEWTPVAEESAPARRLFAAAPAGPIAGVAVGINYHGPGEVSWNETQNPPEGWHYEPDMALPPGAWENPDNWRPNFPITVQFDDVDQYGNPMTSSATIPNETLWNILVNKGTIRIPPYPYHYPILVEDEEDCVMYGHLWVQHCVCAVCGAVRPHTFESKGAGLCAVCVNKLSALVRGPGGEYHVVDTKDECGDHDNPMTAIGNHHGWHHEGPDIDTAVLYCSCQCGAVGPQGFALEHDLEHKSYEQIAGDEGLLNHYNIMVCTREDCGREVKVKEGHSVGKGGEDIENLRYWNDEYHMAYGICPDCNGTVQGVLLPHLWGSFGNEPGQYCKCPCFPPYGEDAETWTPTGEEPEWSAHVRQAVYLVNNDGEMPPIITTDAPPAGTRVCAVDQCERCGGTLGGTDMAGRWQLANPEEVAGLHYWSFPDRGDGKVGQNHWCACGMYPDMHVFVLDPLSGKAICEHGTPLLTPGCGMERGADGLDLREGEDSQTIDPGGNLPPGGGGEGDDGDDPVLPGKNPPDRPVTPPVKPEDEDAEEWRNCPMAWPEIEDELPPLPPLPEDIRPGGDSSTVDPNVHNNDWQIVCAPYSPPPPPVLLPPDFR